MPITSKPRKAPAGVDVDALINKGGTAPVVPEAEAPEHRRAQTADDAETVAVILRLPREVLADVDRAVKSRRLRTPRHTWLLEAVLDKLDQETGAKNHVDIKDISER
jgi:hypothetical protein